MRLTLLHQYKNLLPVLGVLGLLVFLLGISTRGHYFRLDTDYNVAIPMAEFAIRAFINPSEFLTWNPYIGLGRPVLGDPSSLLFSPWFMPWFLLFGAANGLRFIMAFTILCSGISMWIFLSRYALHPRIVQWGAILYGTSGALAAMIASGHIEKFPTYVIAPYVFFLLLNPILKLQNAMLLGLIYATLFFSVDFYGIWFFTLFWIAFRLFDLIKRKRVIWSVFIEGFMTYGMFAVFASPKLIPFIRDVFPYFDRTLTVDPYMGSIHGVFLPFSYIIPWQVMFYDRPTLQRIIGFRFNWYEYYAFITPIAFLPLYFLRSVIQKRIVAYLLLSLILGALYLSLNYAYSPFHWIFRIVPFARSFRVPQRIVVPLLVPLILLISLCLNEMLKQYRKRETILIIAICATSVIWTGIMSFQTMRTAFAPNRIIEETVARDIRAKNFGNFYVANFACCMQPYLVAQSIPILNFYYGWTPVGAPTFKNAAGDMNDFSAFSYIKPEYIIADIGNDFSKYGYYIYITRQHIRVWKIDHPTIMPSI